jgi:hypothetical protein
MRMTVNEEKGGTQRDGKRSEGDSLRSIIVSPRNGVNFWGRGVTLITWNGAISAFASSLPFPLLLSPADAETEAGENRDSRTCTHAEGIVKRR